MLDQVDIDTRQPPFDLLDEAGKERLRKSVDLIYFPAGALILAADQAASAAFVIAKGHVQALDSRGVDGERAFADLSVGDLFGSHAVLSGRARHAYKAAEDSLCYTIPAELLRQLVQTQPRFGAWFLEGMAVKRRHRANHDAPASSRVLLTRVGEAHLAPLLRVPASAAIADATRKLKDRGVDCLIVDDPQLGPGVITRTDLLEALALRFQRPDDPIGALANRPLISIRSDALLFEALVRMTESHIERVVVADGDQLLGTVGMAELLAHYSSSSHLIMLEVARAGSVAQVADAARRLPELIGPLFAQGAKMRFLMELVTALNGRILKRLFELSVPPELQQQLCLLILGSEGRGEQLLRTDQDNALVLAAELADSTVAPIAERLSAAIEACGWPPCPGKVMIRNAQWRGSSDTWSQRIAAWIREADPESMLQMAIMVDARPVAGRYALADPLLAALRQALGQEIALRSMAEQAVQFHTPLSWFGRIKGGQSGTDLKKGAIFPIVQGLRTLALAHDISERNSFRRAESLIQAGALSPGFGRDLQQSLSVCLRLRLGEQLSTSNAALADSNLVHVESMRRLDRELLRDALRVVNEFQDHLRQRFRLER